MVESIEAWRKTADEQKKLGLYVDFENGKWLTPASVKEKDTEMSEFVAATLLTMAEGYFLKGSLEELYSFRADNDR